MRNYNKAAENNREPIFEKLRPLFTGPGTVLELASGSGQHAVFMAERLKDLTWQPSEQESMLESLSANIAEFGPANVLPPIQLAVESGWPQNQYRYVYAANLLHIMSADLMPVFFKGVSGCLASGGLCCIYGPFRYDGKFTTESNARFDRWLKETHADGGIRDIERVTGLASACGLQLIKDHAIPANNQLLVFLNP